MPICAIPLYRIGTGYWTASVEIFARDAQYLPTEAMNFIVDTGSHRSFIVPAYHDELKRRTGITIRPEVQYSNTMIGRVGWRAVDPVDFVFSSVDGRSVVRVPIDDLASVIDGFDDHGAFGESDGTQALISDRQSIEYNVLGHDVLQYFSFVADAGSLKSAEAYLVSGVSLVEFLRSARDLQSHLNLPGKPPQVRTVKSDTDLNSQRPEWYRKALATCKALSSRTVHVERRSDPHLEWSAKCTVQLITSIVRTNGCNLSSGGLLFVSPEPFARDQYVRVLPDGESPQDAVLVKVLHCQPTPNGFRIGGFVSKFA